MMKRFFITAAAALCFAAAGFAQEAEFLPRWSEGCLDIHTVALEKGDATFMIMPDGTTMLIDAGDNDKWGWHNPDDTLKTGVKLANYIRHFLAPASSDGAAADGKTSRRANLWRHSAASSDGASSDGKSPDRGEIDYVMITHFHNDHIGNGRDALPGQRGYRLSGITLVGEYFRFGKFVDRGWPDYDFPSREIVVRSNRSFMDDYMTFAGCLSESGTEVEKFKIGSDKQFSLKHDPGKYSRIFKIRNLAANGEVWTGRGLKSRKMYSGDPSLFDENMVSCAIRLSYGKFAYYNGGDITGGNWPTNKCRERDFETSVAKVCGKVTAIKVDHHGWYDSSNGFFLRTLSPQVLIFTASEKKHPVASALRRITDHLVWEGGRDCYITGEFARENLGEELWSIFKPCGHIVIRVFPGGDSYQVFVLDRDDYHIKYTGGVVNL